MKTIQIRAADDLSLADLARELGVSKYHLSYRFKKAVGVTFRSYVLRARIERAKGLLQDGHQSVTDVAFMVGFNDLARFDKLFKRHMGLTPSAYRAGQSVQRVRNGS
jgi:AraC-like DNA-binding protein